MTPAEFDTQRRMLGLSIDDTAALCGGVSPRAVNDWMRGVSKLPNDAIEALILLNQKMQNAVENAVILGTDKTMNGIIELKRYRTQRGFDESLHASQDDLPFGAHAILIGWVAEALRDEGINVEIVWGD